MQKYGEILQIILKVNFTIASSIITMMYKLYIKPDKGQKG